MKALFVVAALCLAACGHGVQTSSGEAYNARPVLHADALTPEVRRTAAVEPMLELPARIGLARVAGGRLTAVPEAEALLWRGLAERHPEAGRFVPLSPLVAAMAAEGGAEGVLREIRLGAARQHLDAVLVYELGVRSGRSRTPLAVADLTVIGAAVLPTRSLEAQAVAEALLIDVRNGYPYLTASAAADLGGLSDTFGAGGREERLRRKAALAATRRLIPELDAAFSDLAARLSGR